MKTSTKITIGVLVIALALAIYGGYLYPKVQKAFGASSGGVTSNTPRIASIVWAPTISTSTTNGTATTTSLLNTDAEDRFIEGINLECTGMTTASASTTIASLAVTAATTTVSTSTGSIVPPNIVSNTNYLLEPVGAIIATTSPYLYLASTSPGITGLGIPAALGNTGISTSTAWRRIWPSNTAITFSINATNTAVCNIKVPYIPE